MKTPPALSSPPPVIAVCVATYRRPALLAQLLDSLSRQNPISHVQMELRIVDNDEAASARPVVERFRGGSHPFARVDYALEGRQNIAHARNRALEIGPADAIVFIDDDEWVEPDWLFQLWETCVRTKADGVFGPVSGHCPEGSPQWMRRGGFFDKTVPPSGTRVGWRETRTSNTLIRGRWFAEPKTFRFDSRLGRSGGSDSELFSRMEGAGARFVSCREAGVAEAVPPERARLGWLWSRWYRNGLIYERIVREQADSPPPAWRAFRRFGAAFGLFAWGILPALVGRRERCVQGLLRLALALGGLQESIRPGAVAQHVAYRKEGRADKASKALRRVAFLTNLVSPYRLPVFQHLADTPGWDFRVFVDAETEFDRSWKVGAARFPIIRSRGVSWKRVVRSEIPVPFEQTLTLHAPVGLVWHLLRFRPQTVISLELGVRTALAALYCTVTRTPLVIWAYQSRVSAAQGQGRLWWRRFLLRQATQVVGMGSQAREVLRAWGVAEAQITDAPNAADDVGLAHRLGQAEAGAEVAALKRAHGGNRRLAIVVGRLIPLKGIELLLRSWAALPATVRNQWQLVFVGDGPLESLIRTAADPSLSLVGFVPAKDMALWYAAADLHVFPTCGDVWGLVVNEAGLCGTPSLCSVHAGCFDDMIDDGVNGLAIDFTSASADERLRAALERTDLAQIGQAARQRASQFTLDGMAQRFRVAAGVC